MCIRDSSRAKAEPSFTSNRLIEARRRGKEWPVGKKARAGASRPFQAIHGPLKPKSQKTVRQGNEEASRRDEQALSGMQNVKESVRPIGH